MLDVDVWPRPVAERLIALSTRAPVVELTGAEIALMLHSMNEFDGLCVEVLNRILYAKETEKRLLEIIGKIIEGVASKHMVNSKDEMAKKVLDNLKSMWILRNKGGKLYVPKGHSALRIVNPQSFVLFVSGKVKRWTRVENGRIAISGTAMGYAYCKQREDEVLKMATTVARGLSFEDPFLPMRAKHIECVSHTSTSRAVCWDCLAGSKKWVSTAEVAVAANRLFSTNYGRTAVALLRAGKCEHGKSEDAKRVKAAKNETIRNACKLLEGLRGELDGLNSAIEIKSSHNSKSESKQELEQVPVPKLQPLKITLVEGLDDDSISFVRFPEIALKNGRICGLSLSLAVEAARKLDIHPDDVRVVEAIIRSIMRVRQEVFEPILRDASSLLAEAAEERYQALFTPAW